MSVKVNIEVVTEEKDVLTLFGCEYETTVARVVDYPRTEKREHRVIDITFNGKVRWLVDSLDRLRERSDQTLLDEFLHDTYPTMVGKLIVEQLIKEKADPSSVEFQSFVRGASQMATDSSTKTFE